MSQVIKAESKPKSDHKTGKLILSILFDAIGMMSYIVPGFAEITDIIWAPIGAFVLSTMYKGSVGKIGAAVEFVEEIIPGLDFIPTFTLTWFYEYYIAKKHS
jgi:hypothetical protein